jgi:hypothetical protein
MPKILYLTLKKKWFDLIKSGEKKIEYREIKPYWTKRLCENGLKREDRHFGWGFTINGKDYHPKIFDYIIFKNGYLKSSPKLIVKFNGLELDDFEGKKCYAIQLGNILNWKELEE